MTNEENNSNNINLKIAITAIVSVLLCAAFVLALVGFGMKMQRNFDDTTAKQQEKDKIISVIDVKYDATILGYTSVEEGIDNYYEGPRLLEKLGVSKGQDYYIVNSSDKLNSVLDILGLSGQYSVEADFFKSGSIIAIPVEAVKLSGCEVKSVVRDENYNITVDIAYSEDLPEYAYMGDIVLVKLQNIQPKRVTVNRQSTTNSTDKN